MNAILSVVLADKKKYDIVSCSFVHTM